MSACHTLVRPVPLPSNEGAVRVLVVEDDRDLRGAIGDTLRLEGMSVEEAENGLEALLHLRTAAPPPDVIVLDLAMPIMTGWEFCERLRAEPALAGIPVVVLSSRAAEEELDAAAVLTKPCHPDVLLVAIARAAARPR